MVGHTTEKEDVIFRTENNQYVIIFVHAMLENHLHKLKNHT